ncbi:MAG: hypothetical protein HUJ31_01315, partial [Pseudomonadales bacterium]|nr:hypothetical protein [Pseudomonadales bacterium]
MDDDTRYRRLIPVTLPTATVLIFGLVIIARHPGVVEIVTTAIATGFTLVASVAAMKVARSDALAPIRRLSGRLGREA